jgi:signal transduction histidine kinase
MAMWRGIRVRITALAVLVVGVVLLITAFALVTSQRRLLIDELDESLLIHNETLTRDAQEGALTDPIRGQGDDDAIAQVVDGEGRVIASTANYAGRPALPAPPAGTRRERTSTRLLAGEPEYRVLTQRTGAVVVHTASPLDDVDDSLGALKLSLAVATPIAAAVLAVSIWWLVGRTLRPVEAIRREVADITGRNLERRVPEPATGDEIARLARTMNAMLDRVESAVERQQRFVADASHELRSPLTRIRSELEAERAASGGVDHATVHASVLDETTRLEHLVDDLLFLARNDAAAAPSMRREPVDLDDIILREVERLRAPEAPTVDLRGVSGAQVIGDRAALARAVRNVTDNAARHAHSTVTITLAEHDHWAILTVADDGPGIPAEHRQRVFERFTRLDEARSAADGSTGLGLAIARDIVERHGGSIRVDPDHPNGARFVVELPVATPGT